MEKTSEVMGLPVICAETGEKLGSVEDIIFCPKNREVSGFIIENRNPGVGKKLILVKDIVNIGRDAVVITDSMSATTVRKARNAGYLKDEGSLLGLKIYTRSGEDLGVVKDVLFDQKTGLVEGVEVSDGFIEDVVQGRKVVPLFGKIEFSPENLVVGREAVEEAEDTGGGIKKRLKLE